MKRVLFEDMRQVTWWTQMIKTKNPMLLCRIMFVMFGIRGVIPEASVVAFIGARMAYLT